jgi:hypothetical protein
MARHLTIVTAILLILIPKDAWAYLDPGTGSLLLQAAGASIFAILLTFKLYWRRIKLFFTSAKDEPQGETPDTGTGDDE